MFGKVVKGKFVAPPVNDGNKLNVYLDAEWLAAHGFHELTAEEIASIKTPKREIRLSKLAIVTELGDQWPTWEAKIKAAGVWPLWENATYLVVGHPALAPFWKELSADERKLLLKKCRY